MDSMEIREVLRKDPNCRQYVQYCLASYLVGPGVIKAPKRRHFRRAEKIIGNYLDCAWIMENKVEKYVRENRRKK